MYLEIGKLQCNVESMKERYNKTQDHDRKEKKFEEGS